MSNDRLNANNPIYGNQVKWQQYNMEIKSFLTHKISDLSSDIKSDEQSNRWEMLWKKIRESRPDKPINFTEFYIFTMLARSEIAKELMPEEDENRYKFGM